MEGFGLKIQWRQPNGEYGDQLHDDTLARITLVYDGREVTHNETYLQEVPKQSSGLLTDLVKLVEARQRLRSAFGQDAVNVV